MFRFVLLGVLLNVALPSPASSAPAEGALRIAAASDLRFALDEILTSFRALHPNTQVEAIYGSSGNFFAQIREEAPFDLFLSADADYARQLFADGMSEAPFPYAIGRLALVVRKDSGLDPKGFGALLKSPAIRRVAIANPAHAPYGRAAVAVLKSWRVYDRVASRLVFADSVSQVAQFVDTGSAQAGLVALSLMNAKAPDLVFAAIPESAHPPLEQTGVVLKRAKSIEAARAFRAFLQGDAGRSILERYAFGLPKR